MSIKSVATATRSMITGVMDLPTFKDHTLAVLAVLADPIQAELIQATGPVRAPDGTTSNHVFFNIPPLPPGADRKTSRPATRPLDIRLFIFDAQVFKSEFDAFTSVLDVVRSQKSPLLTEDLRPIATALTKDQEEFIDRDGIESVLYTMAQAMGTALDAANGQGARKNAGTLFEKLIQATLDMCGIRSGKGTLRIPVSVDGTTIAAFGQAPRIDRAALENEDGEPNAPDVEIEHDNLTYGPEVDIILSSIPDGPIPHNRTTVDSRELLVSIKTTSKDRMAKMFVDHYVLTKTLGEEIKTVGIFLHDIQRSNEGVASTFVSGMFLVYRAFFGDLAGIYYLDPSVRSASGVWKDHIFPFRRFLLRDMWTLIVSPVAPPVGTPE